MKMLTARLPDDLFNPYLLKQSSPREPPADPVGGHEEREIHHRFEQARGSGEGVPSLLETDAQDIGIEDIRYPAVELVAQDVTLF